MLIYRIENEQGQGIYSASNLGFTCNAQALDQYVEVPGEPILHPSPEDDTLLNKWWKGPGKKNSTTNIQWQLKGRKAWICGFLSEDQILRWFPRGGFAKMIEEIQRLARRGLGQEFHVSVYEVHGRLVKRGEHQGMFRREDAQLVKKIPLAHYAA